MAATLEALGAQRSCLVAIEAHDVNLWKSARNLPGVSMKPVDEINAYDLLRYRRLVITRAALDRLVASLRPTQGAAAGEQAEPSPAAEAAETSE
jgi:ribosomal protein L4